MCKPPFLKETCIYDIQTKQLSQVYLWVSLSIDSYSNTHVQQKQKIAQEVQVFNTSLTQVERRIMTGGWMIHLDPLRLIISTSSTSITGSQKVANRVHG